MQAVRYIDSYMARINAAIDFMGQPDSAHIIADWAKYIEDRIEHVDKRSAPHKSVDMQRTYEEHERSWFTLLCCIFSSTARRIFKIERHPPPIGGGGASAPGLAAAAASSSHDSGQRPDGKNLGEVLIKIVVGMFLTCRLPDQKASEKSNELTIPNGIRYIRRVGEVQSIFWSLLYSQMGIANDAEEQEKLRGLMGKCFAPQNRRGYLSDEASLFQLIYRRLSSFPQDRAEGSHGWRKDPQKTLVDFLEHKYQVGAECERNKQYLYLMFKTAEHMTELISPSTHVDEHQRQNRRHPGPPSNGSWGSGSGTAAASQAWGAGRGSSAGLSAAGLAWGAGRRSAPASSSGDRLECMEPNVDAVIDPDFKSGMEVPGRSSAFGQSLVQRSQPSDMLSVCGLANGGASATSSSLGRMNFMDVVRACALQPGSSFCDSRRRYEAATSSAQSSGSNDGTFVSGQAGLWSFASSSSHSSRSGEGALLARRLPDGSRETGDKRRRVGVSESPAPCHPTGSERGVQAASDAGRSEVAASLLNLLKG